MTAGFQGTSFEPEFGEVYGIRVWRYGRDGRLRARAISVAEPWQPGVNTATCHAESAGSPPVHWLIDPRDQGRVAVSISTAWHMSPVDLPPETIWSTDFAAKTAMSLMTPQVRYQVLWNTGDLEYYPEGKLVFRTEEIHQPPVERCACGFYAYLDPLDQQAAGTSVRGTWVVGIIKGYGRTLLGSKGFRCEKAEIVVMQDPRTLHSNTFNAVLAGDTSSMDARFKLLQENYPGIPIVTTRDELLNFAPLGQIMTEKST